MKIDNTQEILEVIRNKTRNLKTKHNILKNIIVSHPEIILKSKQPDTAILYYLQHSNDISANSTLEEFESKMIPLSTIRNFRQNLIIELKKEGIHLENSDKIQDKATYIRNAIINGSSELGAF